jgi:hypothetical protein
MTTVPSGGVSSGRRTRTVELQACEHVGRISVLQLPPSVRGWYFGFVDPTRETLPRGLLSSKTAATDWPRHRPGVFCLPAEVIPTSVYRPNRWPLFLFFFARNCSSWRSLDDAMDVMGVLALSVVSVAAMVHVFLRRELALQHVLEWAVCLVHLCLLLMPRIPCTCLCHERSDHMLLRAPLRVSAQAMP